MGFAHFEPRKDPYLDKSKCCTSENHLWKHKFCHLRNSWLISVLWDFLVFILRDLIHSTDYSMVLGEWGPVTAQNCIWNCNFFSLAKASCIWVSVIGSCSLLASNLRKEQLLFWLIYEVSLTLQNSPVEVLSFSGSKSDVYMRKKSLQNLIQVQKD